MLEPVAWRVKDLGDGWICFQTKKFADLEAEGTGALVQGLYTDTQVAALQSINAELVEVLKMTKAHDDEIERTGEYQAWGVDLNSRVEEALTKANQCSTSGEGV